MNNIKAIVFDVDGTLVNYKCSRYKSGWDAIGNSLEGKIKERWFNNLDKYYPQKDKIIEILNPLFEHPPIVFWILIFEL